MTEKKDGSAAVAPAAAPAMPPGSGVLAPPPTVVPFVAHRVFIGIQKGVITVSHPAIHVESGAYIVWQAEGFNEEFIISFRSYGNYTHANRGQESPFFLKAIKAVGTMPPQQAINPGRFSYKITVMTRKPIWLDPGVQVDPPPFP